MSITNIASFNASTPKTNPVINVTPIIPTTNPSKVDLDITSSSIHSLYSTKNAKSNTDQGDCLASTTERKMSGKKETNSSDPMPNPASVSADASPQTISKSACIPTTQMKARVTEGTVIEVKPAPINDQNVKGVVNHENDTQETEVYQFKANENSPSTTKIQVETPPKDGISNERKISELVKPRDTINNKLDKQVDSAKVESTKEEIKPGGVGQPAKTEDVVKQLKKQPLIADGKIAKKWGSAVDKTKGRKRKASSVEEEDPFLAKFAMARSRRNTVQKDETKANDGANDGDDGSEEEDEGCCDYACCSWAYWRDYVIDPADPSWFYLSMIAALAVFYNMVVVFLRAVYTELNIPEWNIYWLYVDYFTDFITILDMIIRSRLGFLEQGILVVDKMRLFKMYSKSFRFPIDIISILPFDLFYLITGVNTLFRLNRVVRIWRVREFYSESETRTSFPNMFRMLFLIVNICLMIHWNACIYFSMSKALGFGSDEWTYDPTRPGFNQLGMKYMFSFYWSMLTLTAIGDTNPPESLIAMAYCIIVTLCGVLIFATIFGNVGAMINQMNASRQEFQQNVDAVKRYMDIRKVSPILQDRVIQWFAYTWNNKQSVDDKQALTILPEKLRAEIAIQVHLNTLKRVAIFKDCEPGLLQELVLKLRLQVFSPGDYICRKGDIGKEMYIIKRGKLQVVSPDGKVVFVTMQDGAVFGEVSILNIAGNKTGNRRTASVRSLGYSDLFCLSKDDLWDALKEYPDARQMLWEKGKQILRKDNLLDEQAARKKELADMSLETKIDQSNTLIALISKQIVLLSGNIQRVQEHLGILSEDVVDTTQTAK